MIVDIYCHVKQFGEFLVLISIIDDLLFNVQLFTYKINNQFCLKMMIELMMLDKNENMNTMILTWFEANKKFEKGMNLTYVEFPTKFVWVSQKKQWKPRKHGYSIGRLTYVPPRSGECYYMIILLTKQKKISFIQ